MKLDASIWNLTLVTVAACGPLIPTEEGGDEFSEGESDDESGDESTTLPPCSDDGCPVCEVDSDCAAGYYCDAGQCTYGYTCGIAPGDDVFRCGVWAECYEDQDCAAGEQCIDNYCEPGCSEEFYVPSPIALSAAPIVDLVFVDVDGQAPDELVVAVASRLDVLSVNGELLGGLDVGEDLAAIAAADLDADGDMDLVAADRGGGGHLLVLSNDGVGSFTVGAPLPSPGMARDLELADPENDGSPDAFVRTDVSIMRHVDLGAPSVVVGEPASAMAVAGWSMAYASAGQSWWLPVATLEPAMPSVLTDQPANALATASLDGDTDADVVGVVVDASNTQVYFWVGPIGDLVTVTSLDGNYPVVAAADIDADGVDEAVVAGEGELVVLSSLPGQASCQSTLSIGFTTTSIAAGEFDGDADIEVAASDGGQIILLNRSKGG